MRLRFSIFSKILIWLFLNLLILAVVLGVFFSLQFRFGPDSPLFASSNHLDTVARQMTDEMRTAAQSELTSILQRYSASYRVQFVIYSNAGERLAGPDIPLPAEVIRRINKGRPGPGPGREGPPPGRGPGEEIFPRGPEPRGNAPPPRRGPGENAPMPPWPGEGRTPAPPPYPIFTLKTTNPTRYWAGVQLQGFSAGRAEPMRATLLAVSDSMFGHGLFFDPTPWLIVIAVVSALSILLWLPLVRSLTGSIKQMTAATEEIAEEHFDARVDAKRSDELGRLGAAINQLAVRLGEFVGGQKRFLGDISHELNSPLARMQFALGILEERVDEAQLSHVADAQEEVQLMSQMVRELLAFAKAGMKTAEIELVPVPLLPLARKIIAREAAHCDVRIEVDENIFALAQPELLSRALANVLRNAARYAAAAGPITVAAQRQQDQIRLTVADRGPGVPAESINRLFDPFYRLESDRARTTGGSGLGLAIVKTCIEACRGTVAARNLAPSGLEISIVLRAGVE